MKFIILQFYLLPATLACLCRRIYASSNIIRMIKSRRMRWASHVVRMGDMRLITKFRSEILMEIFQSEDLDVDGRIILN